MKILLAGDLHFNKSQFEWLECQKDNYHCFCLAGDFLDGKSGEFEMQTAWVSDWLKRLDKQLFICSGNHDYDEFVECDWIRNLRSTKICSDNQKKLFNGIRFGCMPYFGAELSYFHDCDVIITHVPPLKTATAQSMDSGRLKDWGDRELYYALRERVITPRFILCGHVENPIAKRDCKFEAEIINPGAEHDSVTPCHEIVFIEQNGANKYSASL